MTGVSVAVGWRVGVFVGLGVLVAVGCRVGVLVGLGVLVAVGCRVGVFVGLGVLVAVGCRVGVLVGSGVLVAVGCRVGVLVGSGVLVAVGCRVGVFVGSGVRVFVIASSVNDALAGPVVASLVGVGVTDTDGVGVAVGVTADVLPGVAVCVEATATPSVVSSRDFSTTLVRASAFDSWACSMADCASGGVFSTRIIITLVCCWSVSAAISVVSVSRFSTVSSTARRYSSAAAITCSSLAWFSMRCSNSSSRRWVKRMWSTGRCFAGVRAICTCSTPRLMGYRFSPGILFWAIT